ncbi:antitoxin VapB family protein [Nesterenkonia ebinurensis]|uniref:antitoxin VapB family protein n=1 Tax=Nesterenkonia ebinurensis TaxID=2608252 RepID=UPI00123CD5FC|nr:antitoxin VapB family protein [Nesterenkonia ebinurensis]
MATKTIAVDAQVYEELAAQKRPGESFSKAIRRMIQQSGERGTGADLLRHLESVPPLSEEDAEIMLEVVEENRSEALGEPLDLR